MLRKVRDFDGEYLGELKGTNIYGRDDEKLGSIDDALIDERTGNVRYLLVDAGWLSSRKFLIPADQVYAFREGNELYANLGRGDVESLPRYDEAALKSDAAFSDYETNYRQAWRYDADPARVRASSSMERFRQRLRERYSRLQAREASQIPAATYVSAGRPHPTAVYGVYSDRKHVESAIEKLRESLFSRLVCREW